MKYTRKDWMRIREVLRNRNIHHDQVRHINCIRIHPTESDEHFYEKVKVCRALFKEGKPFITEAWTNDRKQRFDILNLFDDEDIEIETGKSKKKQYKADKEIKI